MIQGPQNDGVIIPMQLQPKSGYIIGTFEILLQPTLGEIENLGEKNSNEAGNFKGASGSHLVAKANKRDWIP